MRKLIDSHIHLDQYSEQEQCFILKESEGISYLIAVSMHLASSKSNLQLANKHSAIKPAFGFHPEQPMPDEKELDELFHWMREHLDEMVAVGEVGLPYYSKLENPKLDTLPYIQLLERFIVFAKEYKKPIILHAVYGDAEMACDLLEKHAVANAHFHWFKGSEKTIQRMIKHGYFISVTPDVCYEEEIQHIVSIYPIELLMIETDGPWPFEGPFEGKMTVPGMMHETVKKIAEIKKLSSEYVYETLYNNTIRFYPIF